MDGFTITIFESVDNVTHQTQPFMGGGVNTTSSKNILKVNRKPITKITITVYSKNQMRPMNNSMDETLCYLCNVKACILSYHHPGKV
jgi:hypothetical protein